jgi:hypothetical protein
LALKQKRVGVDRAGAMSNRQFPESHSSSRKGRSSGAGSHAAQKVIHTAELARDRPQTSHMQQSRGALNGMSGVELAAPL